MMKLTILCMAVTLTAGSIALGNSTDVFWSFSEPDLTPVPDSVSNPYGAPILEVFSCHWIDVIDGHVGVFPLSGQIDVYLPNYPDPRPQKNILLMLTWKPNVVDTILPEAPSVAVTPFNSMEAFRDDVYLGDGWTQTSFSITLWPNPLEEWFTIKGDIMVDDLSIYTECIPEPATICLLGLGVLALLKKRRV